MDKYKKGDKIVLRTYNDRRISSFIFTENHNITPSLIKHGRLILHKNTEFGIVECYADSSKGGVTNFLT